jgi:catechol 2,3-dioxygenase-like lactoylglutathione lyase family enzyme
VRFLHVGFHVRDLERTVRIYTDVPGLSWDTIAEHRQPEGRFKVTHGYSADGAEFEFVQTLSGTAVDEQVLGDREGVSHIAFAVDDLDAERAKATKNGIEIVNEGVAPRARWFFLKDPRFGGVLLQLVELRHQPVAK